ncbi:pyridoxal-phosphate dependent enzyme [Kitasatospora mediocidica]|uniref:pyridoxal-phosphate dependent enzyme n=1 Tax=Kitasatospora mediocidica TaxID=58352 RepID=UPI00056AB75B|nr:pyridoxal-phosphate dependent enzyme [Kitasatospora mediocidica]
MNDRIRHGILATVGHTPLVRLTGVAAGSGLEVHAKLERFNPSGSTEDRTALDLLMPPIRSGELVPGRPVVLEADSGNLAVSLAQACRYYDLDLHLVVDPDTLAPWHRAMLRAFGARAHDERLDRLAQRADALAATLAGSYRPAQPAGPNGALMREICQALPTDTDYLFCPSSSPGALRGVLAFVRSRQLPTRVVVVADDPAAVPALGPSDLVESVGAAAAAAGCRRLLDREGLLAGRSSGAVVAALAQLHRRLDRGAVCVLVLPDGGDRYAETLYDDAWVASQLGTLPELPLGRQETAR